MSSIEMKGVVGSLGVAIGAAYILKEVTYDATSVQSLGIEQEKANLSKAVLEVDQEIKDSISDPNTSEEAKPILEAHGFILNDPVVLESIDKKIVVDVAAVKAVLTVMESFLKDMNQIEDQYFKERALDFRDVWERVIYKLLGLKPTSLATLKTPSIIFARDITPSQMSSADPSMVKGIVLEEGGTTSHVVILADNLGIPTIVGCSDVLKRVSQGDTTIIVSTSTEVKTIILPTEEELKKYTSQIERQKEAIATLIELKDKKSVSSDNYQIFIDGNMGKIQDIPAIIEKGGEGVGLFRTEFMYLESPNTLPTEEQQFKVYRDAARLLAEDGNATRALTIRTLDIGGDKELASLNLPKEDNPFLGYRAIRVCLDDKELFRTQLRAILRASAFGLIKIMFPFISNVTELKSAISLTEGIMKELSKENIKYDKDIEIGMMVEIPSTIWMTGVYDELVDFFSVGTNDLVQYTYAVDRMNKQVAALGNWHDPALLRSLAYLTKNAKTASVKMCGQMAADPLSLPLLIGLGFNSLSMSSSSILKTRKNLLNISASSSKALVKKILKKAVTADDVKGMVLKEFGDKLLLF